MWREAHSVIPHVDRYRGEKHAHALHSSERQYRASASQGNRLNVSSRGREGGREKKREPLNWQAGKQEVGRQAGRQAEACTQFILTLQIVEPVSRPVPAAGFSRFNDWLHPSRPSLPPNLPSSRFRQD